MIRIAPAFATPFLIGLPIWIAPSWSVGLTAFVVGVILVFGVTRLSLAVTAVGGALALIDLTLALWQSSSSANVFDAAMFGLALLLLADGVYFASRFGHAEITWAASRRQFVWWLQRAAIAIGTMVTLAVLAPITAMELPATGRALFAGLGVIVAFVAAIRHAWPNEQ